MTASPHVLAIGRSDALGLEGLQGDQRTIESLGVRSCALVTSLSSADSGAAQDEIELPPAFIERQFSMIVGRRRIAAIKLGRLTAEGQIAAVVSLLEALTHSPPLVLAPALFRANGRRVMDVAALAEWKRRLPSMATVLVASAQEAAALGGCEAGGREELRHATELLATLGSESVLLCGSLPAEGVGLDLLLDADGGLVEREFALPEGAAGLVGTALGEGGLGRSMLAAGIAAELAKGRTVREACRTARDHATRVLGWQRAATG